MGNKLKGLSLVLLLIITLISFSYAAVSDYKCCYSLSAGQCSNENTLIADLCPVAFPDFEEGSLCLTDFEDSELQDPDDVLEFCRETAGCCSYGNGLVEAIYAGSLSQANEICKNLDASDDIFAFYHRPGYTTQQCFTEFGSGSTPGPTQDSCTDEGFWCAVDNSPGNILPGPFADAAGRDGELCYDEPCYQPVVDNCPSPNILCKDTESCTNQFTGSSNEQCCVSESACEPRLCEDIGGSECPSSCASGVTQFLDVSIQQSGYVCCLNDNPAVACADSSTPIPLNEVHCSDGRDDDRDGFIDAFDQDCVGSISGTLSIPPPLINENFLVVVETTNGPREVRSALVNRDGSFAISGLANIGYAPSAYRDYDVYITNTNYDVSPDGTSVQLSFSTPSVFGVNFSVNSGSLGRVSGEVSDSSNSNKLSDAYVFTLAGGYSTTTIGDGSYFLSSLVPGNYLLRATTPGYVSEQTQIIVTANAESVVNFQLDPNNCVAGSKPLLAPLTGVRGVSDIILSWTVSCDDGLDSFEVLQCPKIGALDCTQDDDFSPITSELDPSTLTYTFSGDWETEYAFKIKANYGGLSTYSDSRLRYSGDAACEGKLSNNHFCLNEDPFTSESIDAGFYCDDDNVIKANANAVCNSDQTYCGTVLDNGFVRSICYDAVGCSDVGLSGFFGFGTTKDSCLDNSIAGSLQCYYDKGETAVDTCLTCESEMTCFQYNTQDACETNSCNIAQGECEWISTDDSLGLGTCVDTGVSLCEQCNELDETNFAVCDQLTCDRLGLNADSCYYNTEEFACDNCEAVTCYDYVDAASCGNTAGLDPRTNQLLLATDSCSLSTCSWTGTSCVKDVNNDGTDDCLGAQNYETCIADKKPPLSYAVIPEEVNPNNKPFNITFFAIDEGSQELQQIREIRFCIQNPATIGRGCDDTDVDYAILSNNFEVLANSATLNVDDKTFEMVDGQNTLYYFGIDYAGNYEVVQSVNFSVLLTAPSINLSYLVLPKTSLGSDITMSDLFVMINTSRPSRCSVDLLSCSIDGTCSPESELEQGVLLTEHERLISSLTDGVYTLNATCQDEFGHEFSEIESVTIDADPRAYDPAPQGPVDTSTVELSVHTDSNVVCRYSSDQNQVITGGGSIMSSNFDGGSYKHTYSLLSLGDGNYEYHIACDYSPVSYESVSFTVDTQRPTVSLTNAAGDAIEFDSWSLVPTFILSCDDAPAGGFGCGSLKYCLTETQLFTNEEDRTNCIPSIDHVSGNAITFDESIGSSRICYQATEETVNGMGGKSSELICGNVLVDYEPPLLTLDKRFVSSNQKTLTVNGSVYDISYRESNPSLISSGVQTQLFVLTGNSNTFEDVWMSADVSLNYDLTKQPIVDVLFRYSEVAATGYALRIDAAETDKKLQLVRLQPNVAPLILHEKIISLNSGETIPVEVKMIDNAIYYKLNGAWSSPVTVANPITGGRIGFQTTDLIASIADVSITNLFVADIDPAVSHNTKVRIQVNDGIPEEFDAYPRFEEDIILTDGTLVHGQTFTVTFIGLDQVGRPTAPQTFEVVVDARGPRITSLDVQPGLTQEDDSFIEYRSFMNFQASFEEEDTLESFIFKIGERPGLLFDDVSNIDNFANQLTGSIDLDLYPMGTYDVNITAYDIYGNEEVSTFYDAVIIDTASDDVIIVVPPKIDTDGDLIFDDEDNCINEPNFDQSDLDSDSVGDACDDDVDGDGYDNNNDNCPLISNPSQLDYDADGVGDACDSTGGPNDDDDNDGIINSIDNCPIIPNADQKESNNPTNGFGDACDTWENQDSDDDTIINGDDNCPLAPNVDQADEDSDGYGDACDDGSSGGNTQCGVGYTLIDGACIADDNTLTCDTGYTLVGGVCIADDDTLTCGSGFTLVGGVCVEDDDDLTCDTGYTLVGGVCIEDDDDLTCNAGYTLVGGVCIENDDTLTCGSGFTLVGGVCVENDDDLTCNAGYTLIGGVCVSNDGGQLTCDTGFTLVGGICVSDEDDLTTCNVGYTLVGSICVSDDDDLLCNVGETLVGGVCIENNDDTSCSAGLTLVDGVCIEEDDDLTCSAGETLIDGVCILDDNNNVCSVGYTLVDNVCVENNDDTSCGLGQTLVGGFCIEQDDDLTCNTGETLVGGVCVSDDNDNVCSLGYTLVDNVCVENDNDLTCDVGYTLVGGVCVSDDETLSCSSGETLVGGVCVENDDDLTCNIGYTLISGVCIADDNDNNCSPGYTLIGDICVENDNDLICNPDYTLIGGVCVSNDGDQTSCNSGFILNGGICVSEDDDSTICVPGYSLVAGFCVSGSDDLICNADETLINGVCILDDNDNNCDAGYTLVGGVCVENDVDLICNAGETLVGGVCIYVDDSSSTCSDGFTLVGNACIKDDSDLLCNVDETLVGGVCILDDNDNNCDAGYTLVGGVCVENDNDLSVQPPVYQTPTVVTVDGETIYTNDQTPPIAFTANESYTCEITYDGQDGNTYTETMVQLENYFFITISNDLSFQDGKEFLTSVTAVCTDELGSGTSRIFDIVVDKRVPIFAAYSDSPQLIWDKSDYSRTFKKYFSPLNIVSMETRADEPVQCKFDTEANSYYNMDDGFSNELVGEFGLYDVKTNPNLYSGSNQGDGLSEQYYISCRDRAGNEGLRKLLAYSIDSQADLMITDVFPQGYINQKEVAVSGRIVRPYEQCTITFNDDITELLFSRDPNSNTYTSQSETFSDGEHTYTLKCEGNYPSGEYEYSFIVDTKFPELTISNSQVSVSDAYYVLPISVSETSVIEILGPNLLYRGTHSGDFEVEVPVPRTGDVTVRATDLAGNGVYKIVTFLKLGERYNLLQFADNLAGKTLRAVENIEVLGDEAAGSRSLTIINPSGVESTLVQESANFIVSQYIGQDGDYRVIYERGDEMYFTTHFIIDSLAEINDILVDSEFLTQNDIFGTIDYMSLIRENDVEIKIDSSTVNFERDRDEVALTTDFAEGDQTVEFTSVNELGHESITSQFVQVNLYGPSTSIQIFGNNPGDLVAKFSLPVIKANFSEPARIENVRVVNRDTKEEYHLADSYGRDFYLQHNFILIDELDEGNYTFEIQTEDVYGVMSDTQQLPFEYELGELQATRLEPSFGVSPTKETTIVLATDRNANCAYTFDSQRSEASYVPFNSDDGTTHTINVTFDVADDPTKFYFLCEDAYEQSAVFEEFMWWDPTAPVIEELTVDPSTDGIVSIITLNPTFNAQTDDLARCKFTVDNTSSFEDMTEFRTFDNMTFNHSYQYSNTNRLTDGIDYTYYFQCQNGAELLSEIKELSFKTDTTERSGITVVSPETSSQTSQQIQIITSEPFGNDECTYSIVGGLQEQQFTIHSSDGRTHTSGQITFDQGDHTIDFVCKFGTKRSEEPHNFTIDTSAPEFVRIEADDVTDRGDRLSADFVFTDDETDIVSYTYHIGFAPYGSGAGSYDSVLTEIGDDDSVTEINLDLNDSWTYYWTVKAQNEAGLESDYYSSNGTRINSSFIIDSSSSSDNDTEIELVVNYCANGIKDGNETDIDCGGPDCAACDDNKQCIVSQDCTSSVCGDYNSLQIGVCQVPSCIDTVKNGLETDIDCGAICGSESLCPLQSSCDSSWDCAQGVCSNNVCVDVSCTDGIINGNETAQDCGGNACAACDLGLACNVDSDCSSDYCASGTCTDYSFKDSDGDGMPDEWEDLYGLNKFDPSDANQDLDADGLVNIDEYEYTTPDGASISLDPTDDDSDGDGYSDGEESQRDTDATDSLDYPRAFALSLIIFLIALLLLGGSSGYFIYAQQEKKKKQQPKKAGGKLPTQPKPAFTPTIGAQPKSMSAKEKLKKALENKLKEQQNTSNETRAKSLFDEFDSPSQRLKQTTKPTMKKAAVSKPSTITKPKVGTTKPTTSVNRSVRDSISSSSSKPLKNSSLDKLRTIAKKEPVAKKNTSAGSLDKLKSLSKTKPTAVKKPVSTARNQSSKSSLDKLKERTKK